ncbi:MAG: multicopper oxidase domain-containing protein [Pyrobaculum sp.]
MLRRKLLIGLGATALGAAVLPLSRPILELVAREAGVVTQPKVATVPKAVRDVREIVATEEGYLVSGALNPTIMLKKGEEVDILLRNKLREETIVHWHGFKVNWRNDAHPYFAVPPGGF